MAVSADDIRMRVLLEGDVRDDEIKRFRKDLKDTDKQAALLGMSLKSVGALAAGAFTVAGIAKFAGFLGDTVDESAQLSAGLREIGTLMGGLTKGEARAMRAEMNALSVSSGQAIDKLVKARYDVVSAGFADAADSALLLEKSSRLAVGGVTDVSTSADLLTTILNAYRLEAKDAGMVSDDLFTIVRNGKTTMNELGSQMGQVIAIAGPLDVSLDEVGASISTLTAQGQSTAIATTAISAAVAELSKPSKELQAALASVGVTSDNLIKSGGGLKGALDLVAMASDKTGISVNKLVSREEALRAILPLVSTASKKFNDDLVSMANNAGAADKAFDLMAGSSKFLKSQVDQAFRTARDAVGEAIEGNEEYKELLVDIREGVSKFAAKLRVGNPEFDAFVSNLMKMGSDVVKNAPGYIKGIKTEAEELYKVIKPMVDLIAKYPTVLEYGIIGAVIRGRKGAIWGATLGIAEDAAKEMVGSDWGFIDDLFMGKKKADAIRKIKKTWAKYRETGEVEGRSVRDETAYLQSMMAKDKPLFTVSDNHPHKDADTSGGGGTGGGTTPTGGSVFGSGSSRADREKAREREKYLDLVQKTVEWYKKEYEAIDGLYDAKKKLEKTTENLGFLYATKVIGWDEYTDRVKDARHELDMFYARNDAVLQADIGKMIEDNTDLFGDFSNTVKDESADMVQAIEGITSAISLMSIDGVNGMGFLSGAFNALAKDGQNLQLALNAAGFIGSNIGGKTGQTISSTASGALAGAAAGPWGAVAGGVVGLVSGLFGGGDDEEKKRREQERLERERRIKEQRRQVNEEIDETIATITSPKHLRELDAIRKKYEDYYDLLGGTRLLRNEMLTEMSGALFGLTGDNLTTMLDAVFKEAGDETEAGRIFADKIEDQLLEGLRNMALSKAIEESLMPMMQPILNEIVYGAMSGTMSPGEMADLALQAKEVADYIAPVVADIYSAFDDAGLRSIEGRAFGGPVIADRPYFVGERGVPELFVPSSNGTIVPGDQLTGGGRPMQVIVQVGNREFEAYVREHADNVIVRAERRKGVVNAQPVLR